ncbi:MAG: aminotransferase class I/II-fold pyridoxal phosphate-dependent enzyme [Pseudomonadota bacterium]
MEKPERFSNLPEYAFPRLRSLLDGHAPGAEPIHMTIGEPTHPMPQKLGEVLTSHLSGFAKYPANNGVPHLLEEIGAWVSRRYGVTLDVAENILPLNGTREGLFNAVLAVSPERKVHHRPSVLIPNPFYQAYAVGALAAGAEPYFVAATEASGFLPDYHSVPSDILDQTSIAFICSPSNPQGAIASEAYLRELLELAEKHDFVTFADECYSEIYDDAAPPGLLSVAREHGFGLDRVAVFHSLSKRSNLPGLRSGFVAGGAELIKELKTLRAYAGAPLPEPLQHVATYAWSDEEHVDHNRSLYREKYKIARDVFGDVAEVTVPKAGFFLWLPVDDGERAALNLWKTTGVRVLPGAYLSRKMGEKDPGFGYVRVAMVADKETVESGLTRIRDQLYKGDSRDL